MVSLDQPGIGSLAMRTALERCGYPPDDGAAYPMLVWSENIFAHTQGGQIQIDKLINNIHSKTGPDV